MNDNKEIFEEENLENSTQEKELENNAEIEPTEEVEVASPEELLKQEKDRYLRLYAEFENYKKRTLREKNEFYKYASQDLMTSMLAILDDFERALKEMSKAGNKDDLQGVELIYQKYKNTLKEKGLSAIEVHIGDEFDVDKHEAITQIPAPSEDLKGKIVDVIQTGYMLHEKVIRFTKVVIGA